MTVSEKIKQKIEKEEKRILEEEKYRKEIKGKLVKESKPSKDLLKKEWWTSYSGLGIGSGCLIPILILLGLVTFPFGILFWILGAIIWIGSRKKI